MTSKMAVTAAALICAAGLADAAGSAEALSRHRHHRHAVQAPGAGDATTLGEANYAPVRRLPIPYAYSFYPEEIEGGVSGNLPFNNQIRKSKDPLNANGGGG